jgi:nitrate/TMAO reductase-like tetraheme cytochrome c subunit
MRRSFWVRARARLLAIAAFLVVSLTLALSGGTVVTVVALEQTAQPEFCNSCHIMEPYFESWQNSGHAHVACIECHYEPGAVETFEGKLQALSQLAKYVTRTQGTKPWAVVSDNSCMRSGCHSVRAIEGPLTFGTVKFDHAGHLLDGRPGKQLRCVTCHSQVTQTQHFAVSESVCFTCHFMPGADHGGAADGSGACLVCHFPPTGSVDVAGAPFEHAEYVARGVGCQECHADVVHGAGTARPERCQSCHGELEFLARFGEPVFLHEAHVTEHKVECFECHDVIRHELAPLGAHHGERDASCASCHASPHETPALVYAGVGAVGVAERPSRMYETRVSCDGCHTGRARGGAHGAGRAAAAGEVDCLHCHGTEFAGMLAAWTSAVGGQLERLRPELERLEAALPAEGGAPARALLADARHNIDLIARDGSRGVHNVDYALDALRAAAGFLDEAASALALDPDAEATRGFPFRSRHGCSTCHLGVEQRTVARANGRPFAHDRHLLRAGLDCDACHSLEEHGRPSFARDQCASCHHEESDAFDAFDCAACHSAQVAFVAGELAGGEPAGGPMTEKECSDCHGEPGMVMTPPPSLCLLCHDEGFDALPATWTHAVEERLAELRPALGRLARSAPEAGDARARVAEARGLLELVEHDGSRGVHNAPHALDVLRRGAQRLEEAALLLAPAERTDLTSRFPFRSAQGCSTCHLDVAGVEVRTAQGRPFPHDRHLQGAGLDCDACHSVEDHGQPNPARGDCASCHHEESASFDAFDCGACHAAQDAFLTGAVAGFEPLPGAMAEKECGDCHGEPGLVMRPPPALCVLCHDADYADLLARWREESDALFVRVEAAREAAVQRGVDATALADALRGVEAVRLDGSHGAHHIDLTRKLLEDALRALEGR